MVQVTKIFGRPTIGIVKQHNWIMHPLSMTIDNNELTKWCYQTYGKSAAEYDACTMTYGNWIIEPHHFIGFKEHSDYTLFLLKWTI